MNNKPLGCLSPSGLLAAFLALLIIGAWGWFGGGELFNPGELNSQVGEQTLGGVRSHAETSGRCSACHVPPFSAKLMADRCLDCHSDLYDNPRDFHSVMIAEGRRECFGCHTDHKGPQAPLTLIDLERFPHDGLGYSLRAHQRKADSAAFACSDCHGDSYSALDITVCIDCHAQADMAFTQMHLEDFGFGCLECHDGLETYGSDFDHNLSDFPLQSKHASLQCRQCHLEARTLSGLSVTPQSCFYCHAQDDAHQGRFGEDCSSCHTAEGWAEASFDHSLAAFQLSGAHASVACEDCHLNNVFDGTPQTCVECHAADDPHQGRFGGDCESCHTPEGWETASFDHNLAAFQLSGAHDSVPCEQCHENNVYKGTPQDCAGCHNEPVFHAGLFSADCLSCHTTDSWRPARFDQLHTFPIDHGERGPSTCLTCHPDSLNAYTCYACHDSNETAAKHREEGIGDFSDCMRCHPTGHEGGEREGDDD